MRIRPAIKKPVPEPTAPNNIMARYKSNGVSSPVFGVLPPVVRELVAVWVLVDVAVLVKVDGDGSFELNQGDKAELRITTFPSGREDSIVWESSDDSIVTVDNGKIECVKYGKVTVLAYIEGFKDEAARFTIESYGKRETPNIPQVESVTCTSITFVDKGPVYVAGDFSGYFGSLYGLEPDTEYTVYAYNQGDWKYLLNSDYSEGITVKTAPGKKIDSTLIPDDVLRYYAKYEIDKDRNGYLTEDEISGVTTLYLGRLIERYNIEDITFSDLKGIEVFYNLERLDISEDSLTEVDLSKNQKLKVLWCGSNSLADLDLSNNTELEYLYCEQNQLSGELDLSSNVNLKVLDCSGNDIVKVQLNTECEDFEIINDTGVEVFNKGESIVEDPVEEPVEEPIEDPVEHTHLWGGGIVTTAATCTTPGVKTFTCIECGETKTKTIKATGHEAVTDEAVAATFTKKGKTAGSHCAKCGCVIVKQSDIPMKTGLNKVAGKTYFYKNGKKQSGWQTVGKKKYYFNKKTKVMVTGKVKIGKKYYYFSPKTKTAGQMKTGWVKIGKKYYYFSPKKKTLGQMATGKLKIGKKVYKFNKKGICLNK